jgi:hypothetical protein
MIVIPAQAEVQYHRHSRGSGNPNPAAGWMPAFAGMTVALRSGSGWARLPSAI